MSKLIITRTGVIAICLAILTGCTTLDPYTGEPKTSNTAKGAGIGAVTGAAIGAVVAGGDRGKGALIGAGIGALAGGAIGHHMDEQETILRQKLRNTGVSVTRYGNKIILNMPGHITFDVGRANLRSDFLPVLDSIGLVLEEYDDTFVEVAGHTDNTGSHDLNQVLSEQRANAVSSYLRRVGVHPGRLIAIGYGESQPIATNRTPEGRAKNRRVEITLSPQH